MTNTVICPDAGKEAPMPGNKLGPDGLVKMPHINTTEKIPAEHIQATQWIIDMVSDIWESATTAQRDAMLNEGIKLSGLLDSNGREIKAGDIIHYFKLEYWEQRSFPEHVDCRGYSLIEHSKTVIFKDGMFRFQEQKESTPLSWDMPGFSGHGDIATNPDGNLVLDGVGIECEVADLEKLKIFEVVEAARSEKV